MKEKYAFRVSVETDDQTGEVLAAYFQVREGKVNATKEYADGNAFADYDRNGRLLGIELLAPCNVEVLDRIAKQAPARKFVRSAVPSGMLVPS